jgi:hypothetical protein
MAQESDRVEGSAKVTPIIAPRISPTIRVSIACISRYLSFKKGDGQAEIFPSAGGAGALITGRLWQDARNIVIRINGDIRFIQHPEMFYR